MLFRVLFEGTRPLNVFPISPIFRYKGSALTPRESKRDGVTGFQHSRGSSEPPKGAYSKERTHGRGGEGGGGVKGVDVGGLDGEGEDVGGIDIEGEEVGGLRRARLARTLFV